MSRAGLSTGRFRRAASIVVALVLIAQVVTVSLPATSTAADSGLESGARWPTPTWHIGKSGNSYGPSDVEVDAAGNYYIADTENNRVSKYGPDMVLLARWGAYGSSNGQMNRPMGIALDPTGSHVYVADTGNHRIQKFTSGGVFVASWGKLGGSTASGSGPGEFNGPEGIDVDDLGYVYVADTGNARVQKFDSAGTHVKSWGTPGSGDDQFLAPADVAVDAERHVFVVDRDSTNSDIRRFDELGGFQLRWGGYSAGVVPGKFNRPRGIAVDSEGFVYVSDTMHHIIQKFTSEGTHPGGTPVNWGGYSKQDDGFNRPSGIAVAESAGSKRVIVCDELNDRIRMFGTEGTSLQIAGSYGEALGRFNVPTGVSIDGEGAVYATDTNNDRIQKFSSEGVSEAEQGGTSTGNEGYGLPLGIAADSAGYVYVADASNHRIMKRSTDSPSMLYETKWGALGTGDGFFNSPSGVAAGMVSNSVKVFVADTGNNRIQVFSANGLPEGKWGAGVLNAPRGCSLDPTGSFVYVADTGNSRILKFSTGGTLQKAWGSYGSNPGQFKSPWGVATDADGNVYVADTDNHRIQVFTSDGDLLALWGVQGAEAGQLEAPRTLAVAPDGRVYVADTGNHRIHIFVPPPGVHIYGVVDGGAYNQAVTPVVRFFGVDLLETGILLDGTSWTPQVIDADGDYSLYAYAIGGGLLAEKTVSFQIDTVKPITTSDAVAAYETKATINLSPSDDRSGVKATRWRLNGGPWVSGTVVEAATAGNHLIEFYSEDRAGNVEQPAKRAEFSLVNPDTIAPLTSAALSPSTTWTNTDVTVTLSASDLGGSGLSATYYRIGSGPQQTYSAPFKVSALGETVVTYWSADAAGNTEGSKAVTARIDKTAPTTTSDAKASYTGSAAITLRPADTGGSGIADTFWRLGTTVAFTKGTAVDVSTPGSYTLQFYSTDAAGNHQAVQSKSFTIWAPTALTLSGPSTAPAYAASAKLAARLKTVSGSAVAGKTVVFERWDGSKWAWIGTGVTDASGSAVKYATGLKVKQTYRARFAESSPYTASTSSNVVVKPTVKLARTTSWKTLAVNKTYYAKGYIYPKHAKSDSNKVKIRAYKKRTDGSWRYVKSFTASYSYYSSTKTRYRAAVKLTSKGSWKLVAYHAADARNARTFGSADYVTVK